VQLEDFRNTPQQAIKRLFIETFSASEGQAEGVRLGRLVSELMEASETEDVRGFVAIADDGLVGSLFFTPLRFNAPARVFLLSPVAVRTDHQGRGIGQQLINFGIDQLRQAGAQFVLTYGDPRFYAKTGFEHVAQDRVRAPFRLSQPEGWLLQSLDGGDAAQLSGTPRCVKAFDDPELW